MDEKMGVYQEGAAGLDSGSIIQHSDLSIVHLETPKESRYNFKHVDGILLWEGNGRERTIWLAEQFALSKKKEALPVSALILEQIWIAVLIGRIPVCQRGVLPKISRSFYQDFSSLVPHTRFLVLNGSKMFFWDDKQ